MHKTERIELKYGLHGIDAGKVREVLCSNLTSLTHQHGGVSFINTLYFDNEALSAYHETLNGLERRFKPRLRWYENREGKVENVFFEFKERRSRVFTKKRMLLVGSALLCGLWGQPFCEIRSLITESLDREGHSKFMLRPVPILYTSYKREYFIDSLTGIRITLDYDLSCKDERGRLAFERGPMEEIAGYIVLECKTPPDSLPWIERFFSPLPSVRLTRSSKYVICLERLNNGYFL